MSKVVTKTVSVQNSAGTATTDITFDGTKLVNTALDNAITAKANTYDLGVGQTWQDVTASRSLGVTYTNSTGKPIMLSISSYGNSIGMAGLQISINGGTSVTFLGNGNSSAAAFGSGSVVIPNGATYNITSYLVTQIINNWLELR